MNMKLFAPVILLALVSIGAGCAADPLAGYTTSSQYRPNIKTVAVPIWSRGRKIYRRELETRLTEAIIKRIELDTPYKVTTKARADTQLRGSIDSVAQRILSTVSSSGLARELEVTFTVSFVWEDLRNGRIITEKKNFKVAATYIPDEPQSEDFAIGSEDLINRLAGRVVEQMAQPW